MVPMPRTHYKSTAKGSAYGALQTGNSEKAQGLVISNLLIDRRKRRFVVDKCLLAVTSRCK